MLDLLQEYGLEVSSAVDPQTLNTLLKIYNDQRVELLKAKSVKTTSKLEEISKPYVENTELQTTCKNVMNQVREILIRATDEAPEIAFLLVDQMTSARKEVISDRDYFIYKNKPEKVTDDEVSEMRDNLESLQELIRNLFTLHRNNLPEDFPVKTNTAGEVVPNVDKLPHKESDEQSTVGRYGKAKLLQYRWNGKNVPKGTLLPTVAHDYVSDRKNGYIVTPEMIRKAIEDSKQPMFKNWTLEFPTGKLEGWLPKD